MSRIGVLSPIRRADGSASYQCDGYSVIAAINGPIEVQRRDELPEEAAVEVILRPAAGVGGVRERHFESIIHKTLRHIILVSAHPRTLIQVTLQVTGTPYNDSASGKLPQAASNLPLLPALLQASILALLSTSLPLKMTLTSTLIAVGLDGSLIHNPTTGQVRTSSSLHMAAFSSHGDLLVAESEGRFNMNIWEKVVGEAKLVCRGHSNDRDNEDISMDHEDDPSIEGFMKSVVVSKLSMDQRWKEDIS